MYVQEAKPIVVNLTPPEVQIEAGGQPVEIIAEVHNAGETADQYSLEIENLDPSWYTITSKSAALFPGDSAPVSIRIHPPRSKDTRAGHHAFQVVARSQADPMLVGKTKGIVVVKSYAVFNMELAPARATGFRGKYRLKLTNGGNSELQLALETADAEENLAYGLKTREPMVRSGSTMVMPVAVRPKGLRLVGEGDRYKFTITGTPTDGTAEDAKQVQGELVHKPPFATWKIPLIILALLLLLVGWFTIGPAIARPLCTGNGMLLVGPFVPGGPLHIVYNIACGGIRSSTPVSAPLSGDIVKPSPVATPPNPYKSGPGFQEVRRQYFQYIGEATEDEYRDANNVAHQATANGQLMFFETKGSPGVIYFISKDGKEFTFAECKPPNTFVDCGKMVEVKKP